MKGKFLLGLFCLALFSGIASAAPRNFAGAYAHPRIPEKNVELAAAAAQTGGGGHSTILSWSLSTDDTTTACVTGANCLQNVYRASGACSASSSFILLTGTALSATSVGYSDTTVTPGVWCYAVTFGINGLESPKDTVAVSLQPAAPSALVGTPK